MKKEKVYPVGNQRFSFRAFTLIELLVVIATITLLSSIVLVALKGAREKAQVAKILQWARSVQAQLGGDMVGSWNFNEGEGTTAYDATGYNNGTRMGGVSWTDGVQGLTGKALYFDGVDDYVDAGNAASLNTPKAITVEAWVKTTQIPSTGNRAKIVYKQHEPEWRYYMITLENNGMANFRLYDGTNNPGVTSSSVINDGSWHHIVAVRLSGTLSIYNNGVSNHASDTTTAEYSTSNNLLIGKGDWSEVSYPFNGTIDEVRIYNRALTAMEIQKHYAESAPRHGIVLK